MVIDAGLVLEGGGTRCVFTAGILDYLMEKDIYFKHVYSLSAGAYIAMNYLSGQKYRTRDLLLNRIGSEMFSWTSLFTTGCIYNTKLLFDELPHNSENPFDFEAFFNSGMDLTMSFIEMKTGKARYVNSYTDSDDLLNKCFISNCFPCVTRIQYFEGEPMLDGGMADALPIRKALEDGNEKCVMVLTQPYGFRKKLKPSILMNIRYFRYRNFIRTVNKRPAQYNESLEYIDGLAKEGRILAFYPQQDPPPLITRKKELVRSFYEHGYEYAKQIYPEIMKYLGLED